MLLLKIGFTGITGLVIAQGLKKVSIGHIYDDLAQILTWQPGIDYQTFEAYGTPYRTRTRDWGIGFHWAIPFLEQCLEPAGFSRLKETQVDPFFEHPERDVMQCFNGETGELIHAIPLQHFVQLSRKISALGEEGINIQEHASLRQRGQN